MGIYRLRIYYDKKGLAKFISHRNICRIIERVLRRLDIPFKFTEGYHPHPKISFGPSVPVNVEGINEAFDVYLTEKINLSDFINKVNFLLPDGIIVKNCEWKNLKGPSINEEIRTVIYKILDRRINPSLLEKIGKVVEKDEKYIKIKTEIHRFSAKKIYQIIGCLPVEREIIWKENEKSTSDK